MRRPLPSLCLTLLLAAAAASAAPEDLAPLLEEIRDAHATPALAALVLRGDQTVAAGVSGERSTTDPTPVAADARWHIGSCTKSMTATLCAVFVERGELSWDLTLAEALGDAGFPIHADYRPVTLRQLLRHRAGLPGNIINRPIWMQTRLSDDPPPLQREKMSAALLAEPPEHPPGTRFAYSNAGYVIAGLILERKFGQDFEVLLQRHVFRPLGIRSAGYGPPLGDSDPLGHMGMAPLPPSPLADNPPALTPAGRVHLTLADWGLYARDHLRGARDAAPQLLTTESYRLLHEPRPTTETASQPTSAPTSGYALGWGVSTRDWARGRVLSHAGSNTMWYAEVWLLVDADGVILVAANSGAETAQAAVRTTVERCAERFFAD